MSGFAYVRPINPLVRDVAESLDHPLPSFLTQRLKGMNFCKQVLEHGMVFLYACFCFMY